MSLAAIAALVTGARPYYLYRFTKAEVEFLYNNTSRDLTRTVGDVVDGVWAASAVSHGRIPDSDQAFRSELEIQVPLSDPLAEEQLGSFDVEPMSVTIYKGDLNSPEIIAVFKGRVISAKPDESGICTLTCMTEIAALQRRGLSAVIQRPCRHVHYSRGCGLDLVDWQVTTNVVAISANGTTLQTSSASAQPDGYYQLGIVEWNNRFEMVLSHSGNLLTIVSAMPGLVDAVLAGPTPVKIAPGCPLSRSVCDTRFSNIANFGGFPFISDNVFDGRQVF